MRLTGRSEVKRTLACFGPAFVAGFWLGCAAALSGAAAAAATAAATANADQGSKPAPATHGLAAGPASDHWAFRPVRWVEVPTVPAVPAAGKEVASPVDAFLLPGRATFGEPKLADRRTLLRRVSYGLTGLPPSAAEVDAFLADQAPGAWERVVERLLASPQYGEHWGRKWLDVVRYADTAGENSDHPVPHAWRYRNWVIDALNRDQPYDEFIREQVAGDLLAVAGPPERFADRVIATGYLAIARRFGHDIDQDMHLTLEDTIDTLGKSVLGLTLGCARCHDHKNDPVTARDYYGLYGIFESTRFAFPGCEPKQQPRDLVPLWSEAERAEKRQPWEREVAALEREIKKLNDEQAAAGRRLGERATNGAGLIRLAAGEFKDGGAQVVSTNGAFIRVNVRAGEMLQLTVFPRGNYGADTTVLELDVEEEGAGGAASGRELRRWQLARDLAVPEFVAGNPLGDRHDHAAVWCLLDPRKGFRLLTELVRDLEGKKGLHVWRNGSNPSAFVNSTDEPIRAWTTLPARTFFVHPAEDGPVAVGWVSPVTGEVRVKGRVADGHPGGGDGVAWRLEHIAADVGSGLGELAGVALRLRAPLAELAALKAREPRVPVAYAVAEGAARDARLQKRGDPAQLGPEVPRGFLEVLGGQRVEGTNRSGRLELASWLTSPTNPLTARVMVNRIWQGHFGEGLVATPNDFGRQGRAPTHPDLLDWLAGEFVRRGWSVKALHRVILASAAYRQAPSGLDEAGDGAAGVSAASGWAGYPRRRLSAEELRDTLLMVSGELDRTPGGAHPFPAEDKWSFTQHGPFAAEYETARRSVYVMQKRNRRIPFFALFDGADPNASTARRDVTTVPTQALYFMNDPFVHARAAKLAARAAAAVPGDGAMGRGQIGARLDWLCRELFGRVATGDDRREAEAFLQDYAAGGASPSEAWSAWCRVLLASNEFLYVD